MKGCGTLLGVTLVQKELAKVALKSAAVAAIKWRNVAINPIITKLSSTKAANAFLSFPVGYE